MPVSGGRSGINAFRIIAMMSDLLAVRNRAVNELLCDAVRSPGSPDIMNAPYPPTCNVHACHSQHSPGSPISTFSQNRFPVLERCSGVSRVRLHTRCSCMSRPDSSLRFLMSCSSHHRLKYRSRNRWPHIVLSAHSACLSFRYNSIASPDSIGWSSLIFALVASP